MSNLRKLYDLFSEEDRYRITNSVLIPRRAFFDCTIRRGNREVSVKTKYGSYEIEIKRPVLTMTHEKIFYSIFEIGKKYPVYWGENTNTKIDLNKILGFGCFVDFYTLKKMANLKPTLSWDEIQQYFEDMRNARFTIRDEKTGKKLVHINHLIETFEVSQKIEKKNGKAKYEIFILFPKSLIKIIKENTFFSVYSHVLQMINSETDNPYIYRTIMYSLTQTKPFTIKLENLISLIDANPNAYEDRKKRYKIRKAFKENKDLLFKYGVDIAEKKDDLHIHFTAKTPALTIPKSK